MVTDEPNNKWYENVYSTLVNGGGEVAGLVLTSRDITEQRRAEENYANGLRAQDVVMASLREQYNQLLMSSMETLTNLLEARDLYTNGHSKRLCGIASKLYEYRYGISTQYLDVQWAAKLHDIGKICTPDQIMLKPGRLTTEEYEQIKRHSNIAADILKAIDPGDRFTSIVRHHHERYDGMGYPDKLAGEGIPLGSRIIAIADAYDAMNSCRPYRHALNFEQCIQEIRVNSGRQFDPEWVDVFMELANTGSIA